MATQLVQEQTPMLEVRCKNSATAAGFHRGGKWFERHPNTRTHGEHVNTHTHVQTRYTIFANSQGPPLAITKM